MAYLLSSLSRALSLSHTLSLCVFPLLPGTGLFMQLSSLLADCLQVVVSTCMYAVVYRHARLQTIAIKEWPVLSFVALLLLQDLGYYWGHRVLHEFHILWTAHSVHHSGEHYNFSTALRQGALQPFMIWPMYIPIALMGFPPPAFAAHNQLNLLFQYWVHTDMVGRMPFGLEYIFNTPSAHRMHHRPPGNQNYGGVLIVWDRIFGTFRPETVCKDFYGLAKQPQTFDAFELNTAHLRNMANIRKDKSEARPSYWRLLVSRRIKWKWVCDLGLLFKPIPALHEDRRGDGPVRKKYAGNEQNVRGTTAHGAYMAICLLSLLEGAIVMNASNLMSAVDVAIVCAQLMWLCSLVGKLSDNNPQKGTGLGHDKMVSVKPHLVPGQTSGVRACACVAQKICYVTILHCRSHSCVADRRPLSFLVANPPAGRHLACHGRGINQQVATSRTVAA